MKPLIALAALALAACGDERPQAPTADENARLDEADAALNAAERSEERRSRPR